MKLRDFLKTLSCDEHIIICVYDVSDKVYKIIYNDIAYFFDGSMNDLEYGDFEVEDIKINYEYKSIEISLKRGR